MKSMTEKEQDLTESLGGSQTSFFCEHGIRFYFFMNHSKWMCQIRQYNSRQCVWDLVDVIIDANDDSDGVVSERIGRFCK